MSKLVCLNCGEMMWDGSDLNTFKYFLIQQNTPQLKEKEYNNVIEEENDYQRECPISKNEHIDTWFGVCFELGSDVWVCPECKFMHIFDNDSRTVKQVYQPINIGNLMKHKNKDYKESQTGIGIKYDKMFIALSEARGHYEYRELGNTMRSWVKNGEIKEVKSFCRMIIKTYPNRPALIFEMKKFLSKQENDDTEYINKVNNLIDNHLNKDNNQNIVKGKKLCKCCKEGLISAEIDSFDICDVCGWEDDEGQNEDPDLEGGANGESLNQYRKWFKEQRKKESNNNKLYEKAEKILFSDPDFQPTDKIYFKIVKRLGCGKRFCRVEIAEFDKKTNKKIYEVGNYYQIDLEEKTVILECE